MYGNGVRIIMEIIFLENKWILQVLILAPTGCDAVAAGTVAAAVAAVRIATGVRLATAPMIWVCGF
jgi:hypothetical protein